MMKVAVSSSGTDLDSQIDPRFGRCAYFIIYDTDNMNFEALDNDSMGLGRGAGIQSAQFIADRGATAVLTGNCGPNAVQTLPAAGVPLFVPWHIHSFFRLINMRDHNHHFGASLAPLPDSSVFVYDAVSNHPLGLEPGDVIVGYDGISDDGQEIFNFLMSTILLE